VIAGLKDQAYIPIQNILVVNNDSKDNTEDVLEKLGVNSVFAKKLGYGNACLVGLNWIREKNLNPMFILICDADGSDVPTDILTLYKLITEEEADLVIGSRLTGTFEEDSLSKIQIFGNKLTCFLIQVFYKQKFTDLGPLRLIRYQTLKELELKDKTWGWNIEMHLLALEKKKRIMEVPVHYKKRMFGHSKISGNYVMAMRVGIRILFTFFKIYTTGRN
jgi:glycosyltransferase involved in cell wall biosynthesis